MSETKLSKSEAKKRELKINSVIEAQKYIGKQCAKFSGKPFKSGNLINTITGVGTFVTPDNKTKIAFVFDEDGTMVSYQMVYIVE